MEPKLLDHLFRHHSGKMVSVLTRIFGLAHLETIEDAVQDTFVTAALKWRNKVPDNPEAWLTQAAKNRVLDIFRKLKAEKKHLPHFENAKEGIALNELFLDTEIEDAQLRMIFTACHPSLDGRDRIAFALKTVSGFSSKEIASALLMKDESVKKRLTRARKVIKQKEVLFNIPEGALLPERLESVMEVLYLIFNEGFHSNKKTQLVRKELCGEAMRLCKMLLKNERTRSSAVYALFALMCFHSSRLESKTNGNNELLDLKNQDRSKWHWPLIELGNSMMHKAVEDDNFSCYHYEAAIAAEHVRAYTYESTNWDEILHWYHCLHKLQPMPSHLLNMAVVSMEAHNYGVAFQYLNQLKPEQLNQRSYLYYATLSEYYWRIQNYDLALEHIHIALDLVTNELERKHLEKKKLEMILG